MINNEFMWCAHERIEKVLTESAECMELQSKCAKAGKDIIITNNEYEVLISQLALMEQELCYTQGFKDAIKMIMGSMS